MPGPYFLKCMGYPELVGPDGRPVRIRVRKHLALLIYLAVEGRSRVARDVLVELLWGAAPAADGRHSLSTGLSLLRAVLGRDVIEGTATSVRFDRAAVGLDLDRLTSPAEGDRTVPELEEDSFLADFSIPDAPPFAHWRDGQQARLFPLIRASLIGRLDLARRSGDVAALAILGERLSRLDPLAEEGTRARMEALAMSGDRMSALRLYEEWKAELESELRARPSESLESIAQRLRRSGTGTPATAAIAVRGESWSHRPFVGRSAEFRQVFEAWESTLQLRSQHVVIEGETGLGKSTLAQRFADAAGLQGAACARVQCFELEQRIPFGMMGSLVSTLLDRPGAVGTDPAALAEIGRLVSKVRTRFPELPPPRPVEGEAARVLFAEGVFALLEAIAEEQPVVLVIDDYPRSDEASLSVLHMLLRRTELGRVMVILTARLPESGEPPQAVRIRKGIASLALRRMELGPLDESSSDAVLTALVTGAGRRLHPPERRAILRAAAGNPLALELLAQDWMTHGDAAVALTLPAMQAEVPSTALSVTAYDRVVDRLVPNLSRRGRRALWLATVLGPRLNEFLYFELVGLREGPLVAALSELTSSLVLRDVSGRLEFTNELMRARLYLLIPSGIRTKLHCDVSTRLIAADDQGKEVPGLEIAWHCIRARQSELATPYLMRGARQAIAAGAPDEASRALSTAMKHLKGRDRDEGTLLLAETLQEMGDW
ncbi:MAG TPA: AAA family ATPase, partial [Gemmatimonadales bacterium]|nr:AAA family ATPase [Gemmatimonadales bacterium]